MNHDAGRTSARLHYDYFQLFPTCARRKSREKNNNSMKPWKTLSRQNILHRPPFLSVESHEILTPQGQTIPDWTWIVTPDYVNVFAQTMEGLILCFRQHKYAVEGLSLAPVGGFIEPG